MNLKRLMELLDFLQCSANMREFGFVYYGFPSDEDLDDGKMAYLREKWDGFVAGGVVRAWNRLDRSNRANFEWRLLVWADAKEAAYREREDARKEEPA